MPNLYETRDIQRAKLRELIAKVETTSLDPGSNDPSNQQALLRKLKSMLSDLGGSTVHVEGVYGYDSRKGAKDTVEAVEAVNSFFSKPYKQEVENYLRNLTEDDQRAMRTKLDETTQVSELAPGLQRAAYEFDISGERWRNCVASFEEAAAVSEQQIFKKKEMVIDGDQVDGLEFRQDDELYFLHSKEGKGRLYKKKVASFGRSEEWDVVVNPDDHFFDAPLILEESIKQAKALAKGYTHVEGAQRKDVQNALAAIKKAAKGDTPNIEEMRYMDKMPHEGILIEQEPYQFYLIEAESGRHKLYSRKKASGFMETQENWKIVENFNTTFSFSRGRSLSLAELPVVKYQVTEFLGYKDDEHGGLNSKIEQVKRRAKHIQKFEERDKGPGDESGIVIKRKVRQGALLMDQELFIPDADPPRIFVRTEDIEGGFAPWRFIANPNLGWFTGIVDRRQGVSDLFFLTHKQSKTFQKAYEYGLMDLHGSTRLMTKGIPGKRKGIKFTEGHNEYFIPTNPGNAVYKRHAGDWRMLTVNDRQDIRYVEDYITNKCAFVIQSDDKRYLDKAVEKRLVTPHSSRNLKKDSGKREGHKFEADNEEYFIPNDPGDVVYYRPLNKWQVSRKAVSSNQWQLVKANDGPRRDAIKAHITAQRKKFYKDQVKTDGLSEMIAHFESKGISPDGNELTGLRDRMRDFNQEANSLKHGLLLGAEHLYLEALKEKLTEDNFRDYAPHFTGSTKDEVEAAIQAKQNACNTELRLKADVLSGFAKAGYELQNDGGNEGEYYSVDVGLAENIRIYLPVQPSSDGKCRVCWEQYDNTLKSDPLSQSIVALAIEKCQEKIKAQKDEWEAEKAFCFERQRQPSDIAYAYDEFNAFSDKVAELCGFLGDNIEALKVEVGVDDEEPILDSIDKFNEKIGEVRGFLEAGTFDANYDRMVDELQDEEDFYGDEHAEDPKCLEVADKIKQLKVSLSKLKVQQKKLDPIEVQHVKAKARKRGALYLFSSEDPVYQFQYNDTTKVVSLLTENGPVPIRESVSNPMSSKYVEALSKTLNHYGAAFDQTNPQADRIFYQLSPGNQKKLLELSQRVAPVETLVSALSEPGRRSVMAEAKQYLVAARAIGDANYKEAKDLVKDIFQAEKSFALNNSSTKIIYKLDKEHFSTLINLLERDAAEKDALWTKLTTEDESALPELQAFLDSAIPPAPVSEALKELATAIISKEAQIKRRSSNALVYQIKPEVVYKLITADEGVVLYKSRLIADLKDEVGANVTARAFDCFPGELGDNTVEIVCHVVLAQVKKSIESPGGVHPAIVLAELYNKLVEHPVQDIQDSLTNQMIDEIFDVMTANEQDKSIIAKMPKDTFRKIIRLTPGDQKNALIAALCDQTRPSVVTALQDFLELPGRNIRFSDLKEICQAAQAANYNNPDPQAENSFIYHVRPEDFARLFALANDRRQPGHQDNAKACISKLEDGSGRSILKEALSFYGPHLDQQMKKSIKALLDCSKTMREQHGLDSLPEEESYDAWFGDDGVLQALGGEGHIYMTDLGVGIPLKAIRDQIVDAFKDNYPDALKQIIDQLSVDEHHGAKPARRDILIKLVCEDYIVPEPYLAMIRQIAVPPGNTFEINGHNYELQGDNKLKIDGVIIRRQYPEGFLPKSKATELQALFGNGQHSIYHQAKSTRGMSVHHPDVITMMASVEKLLLLTAKFEVAADGELQTAGYNIEREDLRAIKDALTRLRAITLDSPDYKTAVDALTRQVNTVRDKVRGTPIEQEVGNILVQCRAVQLVPMTIPAEMLDIYKAGFAGLDEADKLINIGGIQYRVNDLGAVFYHPGDQAVYRGTSEDHFTFTQATLNIKLKELAEKAKDQYDSPLSIHQRMEAGVATKYDYWMQDELYSEKIAQLRALASEGVPDATEFLAKLRETPGAQENWSVVTPEMLDLAKNISKHYSDQAQAMAYSNAQIQLQEKADSIVWDLTGKYFLSEFTANGIAPDNWLTTNQDFGMLSTREIRHKAPSGQGPNHEEVTLSTYHAAKAAVFSEYIYHKVGKALKGLDAPIQAVKGARNGVMSVESDEIESLLARVHLSQTHQEYNRNLLELHKKLEQFQQVLEQQITLSAGFPEEQSKFIAAKAEVTRLLPLIKNSMTTEAQAALTPVPATATATATASTSPTTPTTTPVQSAQGAAANGLGVDSAATVTNQADPVVISYIRHHSVSGVVTREATATGTLSVVVNMSGPDGRPPTFFSLADVPPPPDLPPTPAYVLPLKLEQIAAAGVLIKRFLEERPGVIPTFVMLNESTGPAAAAANIAAYEAMIGKALSPEAIKKLLRTNSHSPDTFKSKTGDELYNLIVNGPGGKNLLECARKGTDDIQMKARDAARPGGVSFASVYPKYQEEVTNTIGPETTQKQKTLVGEANATRSSPPSVSLPNSGSGGAFGLPSPSTTSTPSTTATTSPTSPTSTTSADEAARPPPSRPRSSSGGSGGTGGRRL